MIKLEKILSEIKIYNGIPWDIMKDVLVKINKHPNYLKQNIAWSDKYSEYVGEKVSTWEAKSDIFERQKPSKQKEIYTKMNIFLKSLDNINEIKIVSPSNVDNIIKIIEKKQWEEEKIDDLLDLLFKHGFKSGTWKNFLKSLDSSSLNQFYKELQQI